MKNRKKLNLYSTLIRLGLAVHTKQSMHLHFNIVMEETLYNAGSPNTMVVNPKTFDGLRSLLNSKT